MYYGREKHSKATLSTTWTDQGSNPASAMIDTRIIVLIVARTQKHKIYFKMFKTDFVLPRKHSKCLHKRSMCVVQENNIFGRICETHQRATGRMQGYEMWEQVVQSGITELQNIKLCDYYATKRKYQRGSRFTKHQVVPPADSVSIS